MDSDSNKARLNTGEGTLLKTFGLGMAVIIVMSNIIGSGVFKKVAPMSELLGSAWMVLLAYVLAGIVAIFGAFCAAEAAALFPHSGGPYSWLGKMYGKVVGFLYGWSCFTVIQSAAIASIAVIFAQSLETFVPLPHLSQHLEDIVWLKDAPDPIHPLGDIGSKLVAVALIWLLTLVNIRGAKTGGTVSALFTGAIIVGIAMVILISLSSDTGTMDNFQQSVTYVADSKIPEMSFFLCLILAMRHAFWAYEGWISLGYIGDEIKNPARNLPRALILGLLGTISIYLLINFAYLFAFPIQQIYDNKMADNGIAAVWVMDYVLGANGGLLISGLILISTFGCTNTTILSASRIYYAMAQKGEFFSKAAYCHPTYNTPSKSLLMQAAWASILAMSGSFDFLTSILIIAAFLFYGLVAAGIIILRIKMPSASRPFRTPLYPIVPAIFVAFSLLLIVVSFIESPAYCTIGFLLVFSGLPFYYYWNKT